MKMYHYRILFLILLIIFIIGNMIFIYNLINTNYYIILVINVIIFLMSLKVLYDVIKWVKTHGGFKDG